jgi:hypothetical protein
MHVTAAAPSGRKPPFPAAEIRQPAAIRSARVLSLLLVLESLRQAEISLAPQKV